MNMTGVYVGIDGDTDYFQKQVLESFKVTDTQEDVMGAEDAAGHKGEDGWEWKDSAEANANGCIVTKEGDVITNSGSAFMYASERFSQAQQNKAGGIATVSNIEKSINSVLQRRIG
ncbi:MAG: hypothetical protein WC529_08045 [Candidatus Margulisiibacteriota bacterium]